MNITAKQEWVYQPITLTLKLESEKDFEELSKLLSHIGNDHTVASNIKNLAGKIYNSSHHADEG